MEIESSKQLPSFLYVFGERERESRLANNRAEVLKYSFRPIVISTVRRGTSVYLNPSAIGHVDQRSAGATPVRGPALVDGASDVN